MTRLLFALALVVSPLGAQQTAGSIDPGMTHDQVVQRLGKPLNERTSGTHTYMFYRNGCEKSCGMNDLVVLEEGKVVDAVFRNGARVYTGTSSSPSSLAPAAKANGATRLTIGDSSRASAARRAARDSTRKPAVRP